MASSERDRKNVLIFMSNKAIGDLYYNWTYVHLLYPQPSDMGLLWDAETLEGFIEVTQRTGLSFDIVVVDQRVLDEHGEVIRYIEQNPHLVVGVLQERPTIPSDISVRNSAIFRKPVDIDETLQAAPRALQEWLVIMRQLLNASTSP